MKKQGKARWVDAGKASPRSSTQRKCLQWSEISLLVDGMRTQPGSSNCWQYVRRALEQGIVERGNLTTTGKPTTDGHVFLRGVRCL